MFATSHQKHFLLPGPSLRLHGRHALAQRLLNSRSVPLVRCLGDAVTAAEAAVDLHSCLVGALLLYEFSTTLSCKVEQFCNKY
jgi:hypothetical protein